ncbi:MAG: phenylalanine--tRNA ligase subunit beta [Magnetovibrio sp.]|nr:phenylalanine--tRNA ligase subunit beta [Magnetovibrio sp.]
MKFTLSWLKEHLETDADLATLLDRLTMIGLEVEKVTDRAEGLEGFVVGHVLDAAQHPDADRLRVCRVDIGGEEFQVVCGAPNARTGMKGVFAREGSYVPGTDLKLKKTKIRGVESSGMLLSEREMGLSDEHDGIVDLPEDAPIGAPATQVMGLDDPIIEIAITPNRGDCLGVRGIARDLAAAGVGTLKPLDAAPVTGAFKSPIEVHLDFPEDKQDACPYFIGRMIRGVTNGPSPAWLQDKLLAIGLRPISALVDITNLVTFDLGRPLHVFDAAHVSGHIRPRLAKPGETLAALDGKTYELDAEMCVIADDDKAEGLGGVMGGEASGCTETTTDVYVECAYFDPVRTAMTGRKLNLMSDARYRFERGVDPAFLIDGMEIATRLIQELCGGEASETVIAGEEPAWRRQLTLGAERVRTLGGIDVDAEETERILTVLGFGVSRGADGFTVEVPSWRPDIVGEACLVEEVVRIHGYDRIPTVSMEKTEPLPGRALSTEQSRRSIARRTLAQRGMTEAVTYSFLADKDAALFGEIADSVRLGNPISSDLDVMRPSLLPNLINAASRNAARGIASSQIFEVGPQYAGDAPEDQAMAATGIRAGATGPRHWAEAPRPADVFDAKADALAVLADLGVATERLQITADAPGYYHPGRSGVLRQGPKNVLASFGELHPRILKAMDAAGPIAGFEVHLDNLAKPKARKGAAKPHLTLSPYQKVSRDFAFVVADDVTAQAVVAAARNADKALITEVEVFDLFTGESLGAGKKSLALTATLQPMDKTLTDAEIDAVADKIVAGVAKATGAELRG